MAEQQRWDGLDLLRAVAMLLGLVLHASLPFIDPGVIPDLPVPQFVPPEGHWTVFFVSFWIHDWRMPTFMTLGGFFAMLVMERRGVAGFLRDRALRVFGGMAVFSLLFSVIYDRPWGTLDHLWFLWILFLFCAMAAALRLAGIEAHLRGLGWMLARPLRLLWLVPVLTIINLYGRNNGMWQIIPEEITQSPLPALVAYGLFFGLGQALYQTGAVLTLIKRPRIWGALAVLGLILMPVQMELFGTQPLGAVNTLVVGGITAVQSLLWTVCMIGMSLWALRGPNRFVDALVTLSYPVYVLHLVPAVMTAAVLTGLGVAQGWAILGAVLAGFGFSVLGYLIFIRYTPLDWVLNGYAKAKFKLPRRAA